MALILSGYSGGVFIGSNGRAQCLPRLKMSLWPQLQAFMTAVTAMQLVSILSMKDCRGFDRFPFQSMKANGSLSQICAQSVCEVTGV